MTAPTPRTVPGHDITFHELDGSHAWTCSCGAAREWAITDAGFIRAEADAHLDDAEHIAFLPQRGLPELLDEYGRAAHSDATCVTWPGPYRGALDRAAALRAEIDRRIGATGRTNAAATPADVDRITQAVADRYAHGSPTGGMWVTGTASDGYGYTRAATPAGVVAYVLHLLAAGRTNAEATPADVAALVEQYASRKNLAVEAAVNGADLSLQRHQDAARDLLDQIRRALAAPSGETAPRPDHCGDVLTGAVGHLVAVCIRPAGHGGGHLDESGVQWGSLTAPAPAGGEVAAAPVPARTNAQASADHLPLSAIQPALDAYLETRRQYARLKPISRGDLEASEVVLHDAGLALAEAVRDALAAAPSGEQPTPASDRP